MSTAKILLVDDDSLVLNSLSALAEKAGYRVHRAHSGSSAVQQAKEEFFDLVITDIRMPGMNGLKAIEEIQRYQREHDSPQSRFMVITGFAEDEAPQLAIDLHVTEFLVKPFDIDRFLQAVRDQLQQKEPSKFKFPTESFIEDVKPVILSIPNLKEGAFHFDKTILLKDTSLMGNTYFANYILWQGEVREAYLLSHPRFAEEFAKTQHIKMVTHSLYHRFALEATFGDTVEIRMTSREIKHFSFVLVFRYYLKKTSTFLGEGWQRITFVDIRTGVLTTIPIFVQELILAICEDNKILSYKKQL